MGLADLAVAVIHPLLKEKLRSWDPLKVCFCNYLKIYAFPSFTVVTVHVFVVGILALITNNEVTTAQTVICDYFRIALIVWKTSVSGEQSSNLETSTPVPQIQIWTLTTGHYVHKHMFLREYILLDFFFLPACVCDMCDVSLFVQGAVGSVDPSHAVLCVRLAASYCWANGGLCGSMGPYSPPVDPGSSTGAAGFTPVAARGKTDTFI